MGGSGGAMPILIGVKICSQKTIQSVRRDDIIPKDKVVLRKFSLLELATEIDNVSKACKLMGYSRQQFHEIRRNFQTYE